MVNRSKAKGTAAETACVRWFRDNGFPGADRQPLRGNRDAGDLALCPGVVVEVKAHKMPGAVGFPGPGALELWLNQAALEKTNAGAAYCPLIVKRPGTTDVGRWWAFLTLADFALLTDAHVPVAADAEPVMMTVASLALTLRVHGYGTELDDIVICEECGNDQACQGYRMCSDCLEEVGA